MPEFRSENFVELLRQLSYSPPERRRTQMDRAELLYWQTDPDAIYPFAYIVWRITKFQPEYGGGAILVGKAIRDDLLLLVERLSETLDDPISSYDPPPYDLDAIAKKLKVSKKTISRYRREGLFGRRLIFKNGRRKLAFLEPSVERFLASRPTRINRAANFTRIDENTEHQIILRARRITARTDASPFGVAKHLAGKYGRSVETVRQLLLRHDREHPRFALFPDHTPPLTEKQKQIIHRSYHRGISVARLAKRYGKARDAIYRAINLMRAETLRELEISWIRSPTFDLPEAESIILDSSVPDRAPTRRRRKKANDAILLDEDQQLPHELLSLFDEPALDETTEQLLFARFNYLKYRAAILISTLDRYRPTSSTLDQIETYLRRAVTIKERLARANLRPVLMVARQNSQTSNRPLAMLVTEGVGVLLQAIDRFDASKPGRFANFVSYALARYFATSSEKRLPPTAQRLDRRAYWPAALNPNRAAQDLLRSLASQLDQLLGELTETERYIVTRHLGLASPHAGQTPSSVQSLADLGRELSMPPERVRRIEHRAIRKLRAAARRSGISLPVTDMGSHHA